MRNLRRLAVASGALLFLWVNVGVALAFNGPPPGSPPTGNGSIITDSSNRVGIGAAIPVSIFTIGSSNPSITVDTSSGSDTKFLTLSGGGDFNAARGATIKLYGVNAAVNAGDAYLYSGTGGDILLIPSGNVGIGTASPGAKLDVAGTVQTTGLKLTTGPASGYVLTSDAAGVGTWQQLPLGGDITSVATPVGSGLTGGAASGDVSLGLDATVARRDAANTFSAAQDVRGNVVIGDGAALGDSRVTISGTSGLNDAALTMTRGVGNPVFSILPWTSQVYVGAGVYYSNGAWVHNSDDANNELFTLDPGAGALWYASNNGAGSWNVATGITLFDPAANWKSTIQSTRAGTSYITGGNVGIGTVSPGQKLTVAGIVESTSGGFKFPDGTTQTSAAAAGVGGSGTANYLSKFTAGTTLGNSQVYDNGTNVGVGTASPGQKLTVAGNLDVGTNYLSFGGSVVTDSTAGINWNNAGVPTGNFSIYRSAGTWAAPNYQQLVLDWPTGIVMNPGIIYGKSYVDIQGGGLRVTAGNVGIGTVSPNAPLTVGSTVTASLNPEVMINSTGNKPLFVGQTSGNLGVMIGYDGNDIQGRTGINFATNGNLTLNRYGGNVGIGTVSPQRTLDIGTNGQITFGNNGYSSTDSPGVFWYSDNTNYAIYKTAGSWVAPNYQQLQLNFATGIIIDGGSVYGKSGTVLQPNAGNVGIGTVAPTQKLDVQGGNINTSGLYYKGGVAGASATCTAGQVLKGAILSGGILTGGTCAADDTGSGPTRTVVKMGYPTWSGSGVAEGPGYGRSICPAGKKVVGGGCRRGTSASETYNCRLASSFPVYTGDGDAGYNPLNQEGWYCEWRDRNDTVVCGGGSESALAICE